jgi:hypothetical protein
MDCADLRGFVFLNIFLKRELLKIDNSSINNMLQLFFKTLPELFLHVFRVKAHTPFAALQRNERFNRGHYTSW